MPSISLSVAESALEARMAAGLSQRELADRVGTSQSAIANLELGLSNPTVATVDRCLAAAGFALEIRLVPLQSNDAVVERYLRDVDRTLLRQNLRHSVDERIRSLGEWQENSRMLQTATRKAKQRR
ncbi:MAG: helix-turn-helix domain-containing protein [Gemmatimonadaceae bacterium]